MSDAERNKEPQPVQQLLLDRLAVLQGTIELVSLQLLDNDDQVIVIDRERLEVLLKGAKDMTGLAAELVRHGGVLHDRWRKNFNEVCDDWRDKYRAELEAHRNTSRQLLQAHKEHMVFVNRVGWCLGVLVGVGAATLFLDMVRWGWITL